MYVTDELKDVVAVQHFWCFLKVKYKNFTL